MSKNIYPGWTPSLVVPHVRDASDDLRALRGDASGGAFSGAFGSIYTVWREQVTGSSGTGGTVIVSTTAVPSGYLYVAQCIMIYHDDPTARNTNMCIVSGGTWYWLKNMVALPTNESGDVISDIVLSSGEVIAGLVYAMSASHSVSMNIHGYKVRL